MRACSDELSNTIFTAKSLLDRTVVTISVLVEDMSVSVGECTTFDILTRKTHVISLIDESCECQCFSGAPVDALFLLN